MAGAAAPQSQVAQTPPMGWNSWDSYGLTVTEAAFRANAEVLKAKLLPFGWNYAVIDEGWFFENPKDRDTPEKLRYSIDPNGRYVPVPERFPSSGKAAGHDSPGTFHVTTQETDFVALGTWVHAQGLKFGIHIVRGIPRASVERNLPIEGSSFHAVDAADQTDACPWDPTNWGIRDDAAGQAWYDSLLKQYAGWGVDLLKVDCISDHPYKQSEIRQIRRAIDKAGRPMVLSLSPGPTNIAHAAEVGELANMWRISDDVWDEWKTPASGFPMSVSSQFARFAAWQNYAKPGNWPDGDMLPLGKLEPFPGNGKARASKLTDTEQHTQMTLWAMARSPLILGANLTSLDAATLKMLTNKDLLAIDQTATASAEVLHEGDLIAWRADLPDGRFALGLFNVGESELKISRPLADFGGALAGRSWNTRNLWSGVAPAKTRQVIEPVAPHGCLLLLLTP